MTTPEPTPEAIEESTLEPTPESTTHPQALVAVEGQAGRESCPVGSLAITSATECESAGVAKFNYDTQEEILWYLIKSRQI